MLSALKLLRYNNIINSFYLLGSNNVHAGLSITTIRSFTSSFPTTDGKQKDATGKKDKKISKAMKAYLERSLKYNEFLKKEEEAFRVGRRHLANMMGHDPETFTQEQINEAIEYLFPSGLFEKKARPYMKPPHMVYPAKKDAQFDESGRPFHFLFYTGKPNFYNLLYELVDNLNHLKAYEEKVISKGLKEDFKPLDLSGSQWISKQELETKLVEEIKDYEYKKYIAAFEWLSQQKYSLKYKDFIMEQRKPLMESTVFLEAPKPEVDEQGRSFITVKECPRKSARADVTVRSPGTGIISINGQGIEYFKTFQARNQILFPLDLTKMKDKVDIEAVVRGGGETGQSGAIRWGISWSLRSFVSKDMIETMRLAGLLTRDFRRRERKKPGQEGARRKFTWKKR